MSILKIKYCPLKIKEISEQLDIPPYRLKHALISELKDYEIYIELSRMWRSVEISRESHITQLGLGKTRAQKMFGTVIVGKWYKNLHEEFSSNSIMLNGRKYTFEDFGNTLGQKLKNNYNGLPENKVREIMISCLK